MPRRRKAGVAPGQLDLMDALDRVRAAQSLPERLKAALAEDLRASPYRRDQVAARMSTLLGTSITQAQLDAWTAATKPLHRFPLEYLPAFVEATGHQLRALRLAAVACGCRLFVPDQVRLDLARVEEEQRQLAQRGRVLRGLVEADVAGVLG